MLLACSHTLFAVKPCKMQDVITTPMSGKSSMEWTTASGNCCETTSGSAIIVQTITHEGQSWTFINYISISEAQAIYGCSQV